jgi:transketolase C-terminal domain/subunit
MWSKYPIRKGFGQGLLKAGEENENVVGLCADLVESLR